MGSTFTLPILLFLLAGLLVLAAIEDARTREIANAKTAAIVLLAPLWWWANGLSPWPDMAIQIGIAAAVFALFCIAFHFGLMGGGDVKLIVALSLWLPFGAFMAMLMVMSIAGGVLTAGDADRKEAGHAARRFGRRKRRDRGALRHRDRLCRARRGPRTTP
ncbi:prepilin peptidase [Sphingomonas sp. Ant20]|uniref:A24 family peptidase n=1 Tax=Sphingomonas sp. Ant20 TaxID=104605 RepID=UPI000A738394